VKENLIMQFNKNEVVPLPWTEVMAYTTEQGVTVNVWGRKYSFDHAALPTGVITAGQEILAAPVRLVGVLDGKPIAWEQKDALLLDQTKVKATVSGWQTYDNLLINTTSHIEFDGMVRVDLVVMEKRWTTPKLEQLWLEVPLKQEQATLYTYWPGDWLKTRNSDALSENGLALPFKPFIWLGNEDGGLSWFAESDQGWQPKETERCIEVVRQGDATVLRLHILDSQPAAKFPLTVTFGFQATPLKPIPKDFHEQRFLYGAGYGIEDKASIVGDKEKAIDHMAAVGIKTLIIHEHWTPIQNYWKTTHAAELKKLVEACHQRDMKLILYFGYEFSTLAPEWSELADEVLVKTPEGLYGGYQRNPAQRDYVVCYNSQWRDRLLEGIAWALDHYGFDGVYLDGTTEPFACLNEQHGCGYISPDGTRKGTYPVFAVRDLMRRLYALVHARDGLIVAHQSSCCLTPTLAFVDCYLDGEHMQPNYTPEVQKLVDSKENGFLEILPLATFRAEFMGRNFGVPCEFLVYERPPNWTLENALSFTLIHNVWTYTRGYGKDFELISKIWKAMTDFGAGASKSHPYWKNQQMITVRPEAVKVSFYQKENRLLLVVSNLSAAPQVDGQVILSPAALGLAKPFKSAWDAVTGEPVVLEGDCLKIALTAMRARLIRVE